MRGRFALALVLVPFLAGCPQDPPPATGTGPAKTEEPAKAGAPKPVEKKPFDLASAKTPWRHAKVGDWASYKMLSAKDSPVFKFEVTAIEGNKVTVTQKTEAGELRDTKVFDMEEEEGRYKDPTTYDAMAEPPKKQTVDVAGKQVEVLVIKRANSNGSTTELWLAEDTVRPFCQCAVKSIRNGKLEIELVDFGSAQ